MLDVILSFHKDLSNYSDHDIRLMAKNAELPHDSVYNYRWLLAILHAQDKKAGMYPYPALESMVKNWTYMDLWNYANTSRDALSQVIRDYPGLRNELGKDLEVPHYPFKDFFYFAFLKPEPSQKPLVDLIVRDIKEVLLDDDELDRNFIRTVAYLTGHGEEMEEEDILTAIDEAMAYTDESPQEIIDAIKYLLKDGLIPKNVAMRLALSGDFSYFLLMLYYKYITEADFIDIIKHYASMPGHVEAYIILDYIMCHSNITKDQLQELLPLFENNYQMKIEDIIDNDRPDGNSALERICETYKRDANIPLYRLPIKHFIPEKDRRKVLYSWCV